MTRRHLSIALAAVASLAAQPGTGTIDVKVLSTRADRVSGGDVLVEIVAPSSEKSRPLVRLNGRDISSSFHSERGSFLGLVMGLALGKNEPKVSGWGITGQRLETNYPITGPIVSGPHQDPFICQTESFKLPDGTTLGAPLDANCSVRTTIQYGYSGLQAFVDAANQSQRTDPVPARADIAGYNSAVWNAAVPAGLRYDPQTHPKGARPTPDSKCNAAYPSYSFTRQVAGGPLDANTLKCQLKPVDPHDYSVSFSASDLDRLRATFPIGVRDWSKPGVNQVRVVPWSSFGPAPGNMISTR